MKLRPLALLAMGLVVAGSSMFALRRRPSPSIDNPAHFVASDVATLARTGRPQLVEVFHYG